jgi:hypothetical protein
MTEQEFAASHVFFSPGDPGDRAYLLHEGQVEMLTGEAGALTRVELFEPGDVFGEMALIEERPRALTARAVTAGRTTPLTRDEFEHQLTHNPDSARHYLRTLFERLRSRTAWSGGGGESARAEAPTTSVPVGEPARRAPVELPPGLGRSARWVVVIHPLTSKAAEALPDEGLLVTRFPLRIGRAAAAHEPDALDLNDVWLLDDAPYNVSRNHCAVDADSEGPVVRDRGSHLGCGVNDQRVGGRAEVVYARLDPGDNVLVIGSRMSPYQFPLTVSPA